MFVVAQDGVVLMENDATYKVVGIRMVKVRIHDGYKTCPIDTKDTGTSSV